MVELKELLKRATNRTFKVEYKLGDSFWFCEHKFCDRVVPVEYIIVGIITTATGIEYKAIPMWRLAQLDGYVEDEDDLMDKLDELVDDAHAYEFLLSDMKTKEAAFAESAIYDEKE